MLDKVNVALLIITIVIIVYVSLQNEQQQELILENQHTLNDNIQIISDNQEILQSQIIESCVGE